MRMHLEARSLTTELGNVVPDPQQCNPLILEPEVTLDFRDV